MNIFGIYYLIINLVTFIIFYVDKRRAIRHNDKNRISEKKLLSYSFFGGAVGGFFALIFFRHKSRKLKFIISLPIFILLHLYIIFKFNLF